MSAATTSRSCNRGIWPRKRPFSSGASPAAVGHWRRRPAADGRIRDHELPGNLPGRRLDRLVAPGGRADVPPVTVSVARNAAHLHDRLERLALMLATAAAAGAIADGRFIATLDVPVRPPSMPACPDPANPSTAS